MMCKFVTFSYKLKGCRNHSATHKKYSLSPFVCSHKPLVHYAFLLENPCSTKEFGDLLNGPSYSRLFITLKQTLSTSSAERFDNLLIGSSSFSAINFLFDGLIYSLSFLIICKYNIYIPTHATEDKRLGHKY